MYRIIYASMLALFAVAESHASPIINGDFETGDLTGWSILGGANAVTQSTGTFGPTVPALQGTYSVELLSGIGNVTAAEMDAFLGLAPNSIKNAPLTDNLTNTTSESFGVVVKQDVNVVAGDILSFSWNVPLLENGINDSTFFATTDNGGTIVELLDGDTGAAQLLFGSTFQTSYTFNSSGVQTIGFGLINAFDNCCASENLMVDSVTIESDTKVATVPEPGTLALLSLGLAAMGLIRRRKKV